jgi:putative transposase
MPRRPKLNLATVPQHVIQRGNNRQATCFVEAGDLFHRECLGHSAMKYGCRIYAQGRSRAGIGLFSKTAETD